ncbi:MAG: ATP-binding protein [Pseudomonadota bacterium]
MSHFVIIAIIMIVLMALRPLLTRLFELFIHKEVLEPLANLPPEKEERKAAYKEFKKYIDRTIVHHKKMFPSCHFEFKQENDVDEKNSIGIDEEMAIFVYKFIEKALSNILNHSKATEALIHIKISEPNQHMAINISDNGQGFNVKTTRFSKEFNDMHKVFKKTGGNIDIFSEPGQGTTINATLPLTKNSTKQENEQENS